MGDSYEPYYTVGVMATGTRCDPTRVRDGIIGSSGREASTSAHYTDMRYRAVARCSYDVAVRSRPKAVHGKGVCLCGGVNFLQLDLGAVHPE